MAAKKTSVQKASKKAASRSAVDDKRGGTKAPAKKAGTRALSAEQPAAKKTAAKKTTAKKTPAKKTTAKSQGSPASGMVGKKAPTFELPDQAGRLVSSSSLAGKPYVLYFYPKDNTPGCTKEACDFRDASGNFRRAKVTVLGVSPDSEKSHANFANKYELPFPLLVDAEKTLAKAFGAWALKKNYGREYWGIVRSTFLIGSDGIVKKEWRGVRVAGHVDAVLQEARG